MEYWRKLKFRLRCCLHHDIIFYLAVGEFSGYNDSKSMEGRASCGKDKGQ
jgi:hypothetical protein